MSEATIKQTCRVCEGTGKVSNKLSWEGNPIEENCLPCNGIGYLLSILDTTDIMTDLDKCKRRLKKIMDKLEIGD